MSRTRRNIKGGGGRRRNISVRAVRRDPPDLRRLSRALVQLAMAQSESEAEAQRDPTEGHTPDTNSGNDGEARHD